MTVVVVGGGLAGARTVEHLRGGGYEGRLVLLAQEPELPYERPPLSKGYLQGQEPREHSRVHDESWYAAHDVELRLGVTAAELDLGARDVVDATGARHGFEHLVLATGSQPRPLDVPGAALDGVVTLRTLDDSDRLRAAIDRARRVVVVGGGWIGLEVAAAARTAGREVAVVVRGALPLDRVLGPETAPLFADMHREHGVDLRLRADVAEVVPDGSGSRAGGVVLADGTLLEADLVVAAVGAAPRTALAERAGLAVQDGVVVDQHLRSSVPHVLAVGDVARAHHPFYGTHLRVEHWDNAQHQPATAAATILGRDEPYTRLPYFYTDQHDLGMEYVGWTGHDGRGYDDVVVRGDVGAREVVVLWLRAGRVVAGMNVNVWDVNDDIRALVERRVTVDRAALADASVPLGELGR
ncbi:NAD(P)/FAD-dependent oxidoreductase [Cellulomonas massiliensis]|uniref:NAD(P)/FAD-dependent oxidoreductase n=1 Tax=Cellulomonas massiliensis TaxID=1465811 RepID=UPI00031E4DC9|nr:FAD-dependent oxidoreductase [Cellulomonas massiliensis]